MQNELSRELQTALGPFMFKEKGLDRRRFLGTAAASIVGAEMSFLGVTYAETPRPVPPRPLEPIKPMKPIKQIKAGVLDVGYFETGASEGPVVLLLHGFPYDIHSYVDVAPVLAARGWNIDRVEVQRRAPASCHPERRTQPAAGESHGLRRCGVGARGGASFIDRLGHDRATLTL